MNTIETEIVAVGASLGGLSLARDLGWREQNRLSVELAMASSIGMAPYYGIACTTGLTSTYCGLRTDIDARVMDVHGEHIAGLCAAGEVMGGFHGETYKSGSSLAKGCIFERLAGHHALARARKRRETVL
jgi:succinate dehydrogenase/fumarate reductase flavoprotein subunit